MESVSDLSQFGGRQAGTSGSEQAVAYISQRLPQSRLQSFPVTAVHVEPPMRVVVDAETGGQISHAGQDFLPILNAMGADIVSARVMFVGYGISDRAGGLDEYADLSARGKVVLFLRGQPKNYAGRVTQQEKVKAAKAHGAVGYLMATGPSLSAYERRRGMGQNPMAFYDESAENLPGLWIAPHMAERLLPNGVTLESFQTQMDARPLARLSETGHTVTVKMEQRRMNAMASNVVGFWPGSDPERRDQVIVLGAHHDHFGRQAGIVFAGADDNASGIAILLEIARVLTSHELKPKRSILLVAFSGEEQGLLGSRYYVSHPVIPLSATTAMINVDHAGVGNGKITIGLSKLEKDVANIAAEQAELKERTEVFGFFPGGDHVPFEEAGIPTATIVSSGAHPDFHQPSDTADKVQPDILDAVARYTVSLLWGLANQ